MIRATLQLQGSPYCLFFLCNGLEERPPDGLQKDKFYLFFCWTLQNAVIARH